MDLGAQLFYKCQFDLSLTEYSENRDLLWEIVLELTGWVKSKHYHLLDERIDMTRLKRGTGRTPLTDRAKGEVDNRQECVVPRWRYCRMGGAN
ncbi:hypothetical protein BTHE_1378 [Bifidobacterium thermophilum]|nr:hypothetical protein BTHE_1378 [Bifidobacterium thermophilum]